MEKIYEENQQQNKKQQKKKIRIDGVTMLSFAVALFAIVSLVAAGVSSWSYALPTPTNYGESFAGKSGALLYDDKGLNLALEYHYATVNGSNIPLFCLERDTNFGTNKTYTNSGNKTVEDMGLYYILSKVAVEGASWDLSGIVITNTDASNTITTDHVKFWAGQALIWNYMVGKDGNKTRTDHSTALKDVTVVSTTDADNTTFPVSGSSLFKSATNGQKLFDAIKVDGLTLTTIMNNAKNQSANNVSYALNLSDGDGTVTTDSEKKYYFSPLYTVTPVISDSNLGSLDNYSISVTAVDEQGKEVDTGAVITKEDGEVVENTSTLNISELPKFYVRIAADKLNGATSIRVSVTGNFKLYDGLVYTTADNDQRIAALRLVNKSVNTGKNFDLTSAPDTGISAGQTIYFVGLIVLLCGVGIIYANARPKQQVQN